MSQHAGRHRDGYGHELDPEKYWYKRIDYQAQYEELWKRCELEAPGLLVGLER